MNIVDILILGAVGLAAYKGYKKGFITALTALAGNLTGLVAAAFLCGPLAGMLDGALKVVRVITPWLREQLAIPAAANNISISQMPFDQAIKIINDYDLPDLFKGIMLRYVDDISKMPVTHGINYLGEAIAYLIGSFLFTSLIFLLIYGGVYHLIGKSIPRYLKKASPGPVRLLDSFTGAVLRASATGIGVVVSLALAMPILSIGLVKERGSVMSAFAVLIQNSKIANMFMNSILGLVS